MRYVHTYVRTYVTRTRVCTYVDVYVRTRKYVQVCIRKYVRTYVRKYIRTYTYVRTAFIITASNRIRNGSHVEEHKAAAAPASEVDWRRAVEKRQPRPRLRKHCRCINSSSLGGSSVAVTAASASAGMQLYKLRGTPRPRDDEGEPPNLHRSPTCAARTQPPNCFWQHWQDVPNLAPVPLKSSQACSRPRRRGSPRSV